MPILRCHTARRRLSAAAWLGSLLLGLTLALTQPARAGASFPLVSYRCDHQSDTLTLGFERVSDDDRDFDAALKAGTAWDVTELIEMGDDERGVPVRKAARRIRQTCKLSDGRYNVTVGPWYSSAQMTGLCGGLVSADAAVSKGGHVVYARAPFEDCFNNTPTITAVQIKPGQAPQLEHESP